MFCPISLKVKATKQWNYNEIDNCETVKYNQIDVLLQKSFRNLDKETSSRSLFIL